MARRTQERTACAAYILRSPHSFINIIFLFSILCILVDMFKKPFKTQQQNLLKSSDKRKLRDNLLRNFPNIKEDELNQVLPIKEDIMMQKISGSHMLLYLVDNNPLFFDLDGRGDFYPTLYTLWKLPNIVPSLVIHPPVAHYVLGGADLMLPGVILPEGGIDGLGEIFVGDKMSVCIKGVSSPIAIGTTTTSTKDLKKNGMKGRAIKVLHYIKDQLWLHGKKEIPQDLLANPPAEGEAQEESGEPISQTEALDVTKQDNTKGNSTETSTTNEQTDSNSNSTTSGAPPDQNMDKLLQICFLGALRSTKDKELPVLVSTFYSSKMLPHRPPGTIVDIKKSSYKKVSEFLTAMTNQDVVGTKQMNDSLYLTEINRTHQLYKEYKEGDTVAKEKEKEDSTKDAGAGSIEVIELFAIPAVIGIIFGNPSKEQLLTHEEVNARLWEYVKEKNLDPSLSEKQKTTLITLDPLLMEFLRKKNESSVAKQDFLPLIKAKLKPYFAVTRNGETTISKGEIKKIQVLAEQKQGRFVTKVSGLEAFGINLDDLAKEWQHLFATSTSTQPGLGKGAGNVIVLQGNLLKETTKFLLTKYKISKKYFEEQDKTKKSKK